MIRNYVFGCRPFNRRSSKRLQKFIADSALIALCVPLALLFFPQASEATPPKSVVPSRGEPYASTYKPRSTEPMLIVGANVLTGTGEKLEGVTVHVVGGRIAAIGPGVDDPDAHVVEADGLWLTPGIIDVHSHLGNYPAPAIDSNSDGNEMTAPNTANVWAEHSVWPQDPQFPMALAGGVTTLQVLPGSANLFGGRGVTLKNVPSRTVQAMKYPGAPQSLKMACGENPKRVYGTRNQLPSTRMGNIAGFRSAWAEASSYRHKLAANVDGNTGEESAGADPGLPERDLSLETLVGALDGELLVHIHCYRVDEMAIMIDLAREFGYEIAAFHHAVESYKYADVLAREGICSAMWADWWGFKLEFFDAINENVALVDQAGACAIVHSDSPRGIQRLNQEAAKALAAGRRAGFDISDAEAIRWITSNAARALGIEKDTGSIEVGKAADLVLWDTNPFSIYARAQQVYIDGFLYYDRNNPERFPLTDFDLEQTARGRQL